LADDRRESRDFGINGKRAADEGKRGAGLGGPDCRAAAVITAYGLLPRRGLPGVKRGKSTGGYIAEM